MSPLLQLTGANKICTSLGCCVNSICSNTLYCSSCFQREKLKREVSQLLYSLIFKITGLYYYGDFILNDPYLCIQTKFTTAMRTIENLTRQGSRKRDGFPVCLTHRPNFLGVKKSKISNSSCNLREVTVPSLRRDTCFFHSLRDIIKSLLEQLLSNSATSSTTADLIDCNPCLQFLRQIKKELDITKREFEVITSGLRMSDEGTSGDANEPAHYEDPLIM